jgi:hypothetical protein
MVSKIASFFFSSSIANLRTDWSVESPFMLTEPLSQQMLPGYRERDYHSRVENFLHANEVCKSVKVSYFDGGELLEYCPSFIVVR